MEMSDEELYRTAVGIMALAYRETHGGSGYKSEESMASLLALLTDLSGFTLELRAVPDEDAVSLAERAATQVAEVAQVRMARALHASALAFIDICDQIKKEAPSLDIEDLISRVALRAARGFGSAG
jgi:hypothetical protein